MSNQEAFTRRLPADAVRVGAALGNTAAYLRADARANLDHLWVAATNRWYFGDVRVEAHADGAPLSHAATDFGPEHTAGIVIGEGIEVTVRLEAASTGAAEACHTIAIRNHGANAASVSLTIDGCFGARPSPLHRKQPAQADIDRTFTPKPGAGVRTLAAHTPEGDTVSVTVSAGPKPAMGEADRWSWRAEIEVPAGDTVTHVVTYRVESPAPAAWSAEPAPKRERQALPLFGSGSREVDLGVFWGAVNARRVFHRFRHGWGFTNDPPGDIIVTRDAAWYVLGADWYAPDVSRRILDTLIRIAPYPDGKIAEYIPLDGDEPVRADYGLNIADPTPLFIIAASHHAAVTGDRDWARAAYPVVSRAVGYLLEQVRDGLVVCTSQSSDPGSGQCGWRNILSDIRITGATAELQAECCAAIGAFMRLAASAGEGIGALALMDDLRRLAAGLGKLYDKEAGHYRLAMDPKHPGSEYGRDDTLDQVFPAALGFARKDDDLARRLSTPAYRTPWGLRTVPTDSPQYHPTDQAGLIGGIWPNATAWASAALAHSDPALAWELAADTARLALLEKPTEQGACVYGEFPEFLNGDTGCNFGGMAMSPWMGPTFVWLAVEKLLGLDAGTNWPTVNPLVASGAPPVFARGLTFRGKPLSLLATPDHLFATMRAECQTRRTVVAKDVTHRYTDSPHAIVMEGREGAIAYLAPHAEPPADARGILAGMKPGEMREG